MSLVLQLLSYVDANRVEWVRFLVEKNFGNCRWICIAFREVLGKSLDGSLKLPHENNMSMNENSENRRIIWSSAAHFAVVLFVPS